MRPRRIRKIYFDPKITYFKPAGVGIKDLKQTELTKEELEVIRLIDYEKVEQTIASKKMNVSQPTFSRILCSARKKIADSLINGKAIRIKGGDFEIAKPRRKSHTRGCVCPNCGHKEPHTLGEPCKNKSCPKCKTKMIRK